MQLPTTLNQKGLVQLRMSKLLVHTYNRIKPMILYVSSKELTKDDFALRNYSIDYCFNDFESIINYIQKAGLKSKNRVPCIIFIDIPFNQIALEKLYLSIRYNRLSSKVSIFYNGRHLNNSQAKFLKFSDLIDDCFNFEQDQLISDVIKTRYQKKKYQSVFLYNTVRKIQQRRKNRETVFLLKTIFDSVVAMVFFVVLLPVFISIALAIHIESKGPIFYTSQRAGRGYRIFKFYKFRSMVVDADKKVDTLRRLNQYDCDTKGPVFFKVSNDPRVTRIGKFLRNTSLDELPQLFNVMKGDMSLVGNRPLPLYEAETLTTDEYVERFVAPAGITGLWQTKKRGKPEMSIEERIKLDITYSRKASPAMDLKILLRTPYALFQKSNV